MTKNTCASVSELQLAAIYRYTNTSRTHTHTQVAVVEAH